MRVIILLLFSMAFLFSCKSKDTRTDRIEDSLMRDTAGLTRSKENNISLQGTWWADSNDNSALFLVDGDSLYYTEDLTNPYLIAIRKDTIELSSDSLRSFFVLKKLTNDSLIIYDPSLTETIRLFKKSDN